VISLGRLGSFMMIFAYRGHEARVFTRGPNWWQVTFPPTRKRTRWAFIWRYAD
jgi:hypothetical protein